MAVKKTETTAKSKTTPAKKEVKPAEKASEVKTEVKAEAEEVKEPVKKTTRRTSTKTAAAKAEEAKKETVKKESVKKETVKKEAVKKETAKKVKAEPEVKETVHFEFGGKTYTPEDLLKISKDVWKYDLNGKEEDFKSVELYVKPEESITYYVINGDVKGSFNI